MPNDSILSHTIPSHGMDNSYCEVLCVNVSTYVLIVWKKFCTCSVTLYAVTSLLDTNVGDAIEQLRGHIIYPGGIFPRAKEFCRKTLSQKAVHWIRAQNAQGSQRVLVPKFLANGTQLSFMSFVCINWMCTNMAMPHSLFYLTNNWFFQLANLKLPSSKPVLSRRLFFNVTIIAALRVECSFLEVRVKSPMHFHSCTGEGGGGLNPHHCSNIHICSHPTVQYTSISFIDNLNN